MLVFVPGSLTTTADTERDHLIDRLMITASRFVSIHYAKEYSRWIMEAGERYRIDPKLLLALFITESGLDHNAVGPLAYDGRRYKGIAQVPKMMPPRQSIREGARILREKMEESRSIAVALSKYKGFGGQVNGHVRKVLKIARDI